MRHRTLATGIGLGAIGVIAATLTLALFSPVGRAVPERTVSPEQEILVRDGFVTQEEYATAAQRMVGCLREAGIEVSDPELGPQGSYSYRYLAGSEAESTQSRRAIVEGCYDLHLREVAVVHQRSEQYVRSGVELGWSVQRCVELRKPGFQFPADQQDLMATVGALAGEGDRDFLDCQDTVMREAFEASEARGGSVGISFQPLPR